MSPVDQAATKGRAAELRVARAIARIWNEGIDDRIATFETDPRNAVAIGRLLTERAARWPTVVVEREGDIVAWAGASEYRTRACNTGVAEFSIYVAREHRGKGAGRAAPPWRRPSRRAKRARSTSCSRACSPKTVRACDSCGGWDSARSVWCRRHGKLDGERRRDTVIVERLIGEVAR